MSGKSLVRLAADGIVGGVKHYYRGPRHEFLMAKYLHGSAERATQEQKERRPKLEEGQLARDEKKSLARLAADGIIGGVKHYYRGTRLLVYETKLSSKYLWQVVVRRQQLNRSERQQLVRTVSDLVRLVPFSVFIIVPFMEFLLPLYIKIFPNMMPSTFRKAKEDIDREGGFFRQLKARFLAAKFLRGSVEKAAQERKEKKQKLEEAQHARDEKKPKLEEAQPVREEKKPKLEESQPARDEEKPKLEEEDAQYAHDEKKQE